MSEGVFWGPGGRLGALVVLKRYEGTGAEDYWAQVARLTIGAEHVPRLLETVREVMAESDGPDA